MQLKIMFKEDITGQRLLQFPVSISENQELLEILKTEYSQWWLNEVEKKLLFDTIQQEKERPVFIQKTA